MNIPYLLSLKIQFVLNILIILVLIFILFHIVRLIYKVRDNKEENKKKYIKNILIYTGILICIFILINIFFQYDPLNIIEDVIIFKELPL